MPVRSISSRVRLFAGSAVRTSDHLRQCDILGDAQFWQQIAPCLLPDMTSGEAAIVGTLRIIEAGKVIARYEAAASAGNIECAEHVEQCRFPGPRGPHKRDHLAWRNLQIQSLERHDLYSRPLNRF